MKDTLLQRLKSPAFTIPFIITWCLLESPAIVGVLFYWITQNGKWWALAGGWIALTSAPLPVPVIPICLAVATAVERIIHRGRGNAVNKRNKNNNR